MQSPKINNSTLEANRQANFRERFEALIMSNPALYKKMVAYQKFDDQNPSPEKKEKRLSFSEAMMAKRAGRSFKKVISTNEK